MSTNTPDPRFQFFQQVLQNGVPIGFKLPKSNYLYKYDQKGGWFDQNNKYYNSQGVFQFIQQQWVDDQIVNQMQQIIRQQQGDEQSQQEFKLSLQERIFIALSKLQKGQVTKYFSDKKVRIYFRSKKQNKPAQIPRDAKYSIQQKNKLIKQQLVVVNKQKQAYLQNLPFNTFIDFSLYEQQTYWFGYSTVAIQDFKATYNQLKSNKDFGILKVKTLYQLLNYRSHSNNENSKKQQLQKLQKLQKFKSIKVILNNIPAQFPLSSIYDLLEQISIKQQQFNSIVLFDNKAQIIANVNGAIKLIQLQGYMLDEDSSISISVQGSNLEFKTGKYYFVYSEIGFEAIFTADLLLQSSAQCVAKVEGTQKYIAITQKYLARLLMYRGTKFIQIKLSKFI